ncbi:hypothetical protein K402DRAFT_411465 [Aulographum hederae CBS 113979]|uniref:PCI domain-containing protein n=1 Tax=Aulographum hederae CBS 113979 TaxID=1176131 RepID=A0A6G1H5T1_9PEZI|nr:hypothetical protein K402DRAFT_411465 [Aulographum hederae CBS 113979]
MEQVRALNALEPFVALSKSANSPRAAADLITQATSAPNTYIFAELLQTPNIQALRDSPDHKQYLRLLEIFAWGTWADYTGSQGLPPLTDPQASKLRHLSLLPLSTASDHKYTTLQNSLALPTPRALENLIISAIYAGLITAHLDPAHQTVYISSVAPLRDLAPGSLPDMTAALEAWAARCETAVKEVEKQMESIRSKADARGQDEEAAKTRTERALEEYNIGSQQGKNDDNGNGGGSGLSFAGLLGKNAKGRGKADAVPDDEMDLSG